MLRRLLFLFAPLALAACDKPLLAPPPVDAEPALWVVRDADTTVYLFGTVHVLKPGYRWFQKRVRKAFDASDELVLELAGMTLEQKRQAMAAVAMADSPPLSRRLPPAALAKLQQELAEIGVRPDAVERMAPWRVAIKLSGLAVRDAGYKTEFGVEPTLTGAAAQGGKRVIGLETPVEQFGYFARLPLAAQDAMLLRTIEGLPRTKARVDAATQAWSKGDPETLARLVNEDLKDAPELSAALVVERNRHWADWIARRMAQPGTLFVAVGAGHLAGPDSLQAELGKRGMTVDRVP